jgi:hypothetical protein
MPLPPNVNWDLVHQTYRDHIRLLCQRFFPHGREVGHEWWIGSISGEKGDSLKIELDDLQKAGLWTDFATGEHGSFLDLLRLSRGWSLTMAAEEIAATLGINPEVWAATPGPNPAGQYRQRPPPPASGPNGQFDWDKQYRMNPKQVEELVNWRGYRLKFCEWIAWTHPSIGRTGRYWVTPVRNASGQIVAVHKRIEKNNWPFEPSLKSLGMNLVPLIIGDLDKAIAVVIGESQWDVYAALDAHGIEAGAPIAGIATRGAKNASLLLDIKLAKSVRLYTVGQNDADGKAWTEEVKTIRHCHVISVPPEHHDLNDWLKNAANGLTEFMAAWDAARSTRPVLIELLTPSELKAYQPPPGTLLVGDNHIVRGSVFVIGGAPSVGKSRTTVALGEAGATLYEWFGLKVHCKFKTMIIQNENGRYRLSLEFANLDVTLLDDYLRISPPPPQGLCFSKALFREQLKELLDQFEPAVVILDPWNAVARDDKQKDYLESFELVQSILPGGDQRPALGIAAHTHKPTLEHRANRGRNLINSLSGSLVLGSIPRTIWILQSATDSVTDNRVVVTCCKNNDGELGDRTVWERNNGLFTPVTGFDWDAFDNPPKPGASGGITETTMSAIFDHGYKSMRKDEAVAELKNMGFSKSPAYRAMDHISGPYKHRLIYDKKTKLYSWNPN